MFKNTRILLMTTALMLLPAAQAHAVGSKTTPTGESVVAGSATFDRPAVGELNVQQTTDRAVINWDNFDIGKNASTEFFQPNTNSLAVNRVTGSDSDPTQILGRLSANGRLMVLDRNGVLFGKYATIDVGGIIASTGTVSNSDIMDGDAQIQLNDANEGVIENRGTISAADAGLVGLVAPIVRNSGVINARLGRVSLAAGSQATVDLFGDNLITLAVDGDLDHALIEQRSNGRIFAESGNVQITTDVARDIVDNSINMKGIVDVSSVTQKAGKIILSGAADATIHGKLLAGQEGGGGDIEVDAFDISVGRNARLAADTTFFGDGGTVTLTARNGINSLGKITANGEEAGGTVTIHAGDNVNIAGRVEARATGTSAGGLIDISSGGDETRIASHLNVNGIDAAGTISLNASNILTVTDKARLYANSLSTGRGGVVNLEGGDIALHGDIFFSGQEGGGEVNINADGPVNATGTMEGTGLVIGTGGHVTIESDQDVNQLGRIAVNGASGGGQIDIEGDRVLVTDLRADAIASTFPDIVDPADGGTVNVTGDSHVTLDGKISARGGPFGGDGGIVTFSRPNTVTPGSQVDVSAPDGDDGEFNH